MAQPKQVLLAATAYYLPTEADFVRVQFGRWWVDMPKGAFEECQAKFTYQMVDGHKICDAPDGEIIRVENPSYVAKTQALVREYVGHHYADEVKPDVVAQEDS